MIEIINKSIEAHSDLAMSIKKEYASQIEAIARCMGKALKAGRVIFWCGNGGSAADSQHLAAELIGKFKRDRRSIPSIALTTDTSVLTCLGNDYGYDNIFCRQVEGLVKEGDVLVGLSTSGNSNNVLKAMVVANEIGAITIGLLGGDGGAVSDVCAYKLVVPSTDTARIQEMHIMIGHILCEILEQSCEEC